jgi:uncharacterized membrane protein YhiD involved in acid resistance
MRIPELPARSRLNPGLAAVLLLVLLLAVGAWSGAAQDFPPAAGAENAIRNDAEEPWRDALIALPLAALLGAALAFRPLRRGTPARDPAVIQTQVVLSVVGAVIMLVVGASLARAFGILGAANLVRYRAKIDDPKDAAVMLVALAVGLATGVGVYLVAAISTVFILALLWGLESFEPAPRKQFLLKVTGKEIAERREELEQVLRRQKVLYEIRSTGAEGLAYQVDLPARRRTDQVADAILALAHEGETTVEWETPRKGS